MVCDLCHENEAVIFLEQFGKGLKRKINLCPSCAQSRGISAPVPTKSQVDLVSIFAEVDEKHRQAAPESKKLCPGCGRSLFDIKKSGFAGCPECYEVFKQEIAVSMNEHGITGKYTGSLPKRLKGFRNALTDRADLQAKLDEAVRQENYEKAAVYRDYLRALEKNCVESAEENEDGKE